MLVTGNQIPKWSLGAVYNAAGQPRAPEQFWWKRYFTPDEDLL